MIHLSSERPKVALQGRERTRYALRPGERARYALVIDPTSGRVRMGRVKAPKR